MIEVVEVGAPAGSVLVRIRPAPSSGAAVLPPVPAGFTVTVTVGDHTRAELSDDLARNGYRVAGIVEGAPPDVVDLLVTPALQLAASGWWREILALADRVFDLRMGPVQHVFDRELALHLAALD